MSLLHNDHDQNLAAHLPQADHRLTFQDVLVARAGGPRLMTEVALLRTRQICGDLAIITAGAGFDLWVWFKPEPHEVSRVQRIVGHAWGATWSFLAVRPPCRRWVRNAVWHLDHLPALFVGEESDGQTILVHDCIDEVLPSFAGDHVVHALARSFDVKTLWLEAVPSTPGEEREAARFDPASVTASDLTALRARVRAAQREGRAR